MARNIFLSGALSNDETWKPEYITAVLMAYDEMSNDPIKLYVASPGGSVAQMFQIINTMKSLRSPVYTIAVGDCSSAGAVIFLAGYRRFIGQYSRLMLHEISSGIQGNINSMRETMEEITKRNDTFIRFIADATGQTEEKIRGDVTKKDFFLNAQEALDYGAATDILTPENREVYQLSERANFAPNEFKFSDVSGGGLIDLQLMKSGEFISPAYGKFALTVKDLEAFKNNFDRNVRGIELAVDNTHNNDGGEKPAWGWIKKVFLKNNATELWGKIQFTPDALGELKQGKYKYFSPEFQKSYTNEKGEKFENVLLGGTLTNRPFLKMDAVKLSENTCERREVITKIKESAKMDKATLVQKLSEMGVNVAELEAKATKLSEVENALSEANKKITALEAAEATRLADAEKAEKKSVIDTAISEGKLTEAGRPVFEKMSLDVLKETVGALPKKIDASEVGSGNPAKPKEEKSDFEAKAMEEAGLSAEDAEKYGKEAK